MTDDGDDEEDPTHRELLIEIGAGDHCVAEGTGLMPIPLQPTKSE